MKRKKHWSDILEMEVVEVIGQITIKWEPKPMSAQMKLKPTSAQTTIQSRVSPFIHHSSIRFSFQLSFQPWTACERETCEILKPKNGEVSETKQGRYRPPRTLRRKESRHREEFRRRNPWPCLRPLSCCRDQEVSS